MFSPKPGRASVESMSIELEEGTKPQKLHPYRVPERLKARVKDELHKIVEDGYAVPSKKHPLCLCLSLMARLGYVLISGTECSYGE